MNHKPVLVSLMILSIQLSGCATTIAKWEQSSLRNAVLKLHEEQLQDNLVRAKTGKLFIHLRYSTLTGQVTINNNADLTYTETNPPMAGITNVWRWVFGGSTANLIKVVSEPVTDNESVYKAYMKFAENDDYFKERPSKLDAERCGNDECYGWPSGGKYYYVTKKGMAAFQNLMIQTIVSKATIEVPEEVSKTIIAVEDVSDTEGYKIDKDKKQHFLLLTFDSEVPNIGGQLKVPIDERLQRVFKVKRFEAVDINKPTDKLVLFYSELDETKGHNIPVKKLESMLRGALVTLELEGMLKVRRIPIEAFSPTLKLEQLQLEELRSQPSR